jgi:hypothetical protein
VKRAETEAVRSKQWELLPHELKIALNPGDLDKLLSAALLGKGDAKERKVWLFDSKARALAKRGVTLRLRQKTSEADFTVKVRPVAPELIQGRWLTTRTLELEADVVGGKPQLSASIERALEAVPEEFEAALLSPLQRAFLKEVAQVELPEGLRRTRAAESKVWKTGEVRIERWELPSGPPVLEASMTVPGTRAAAATSWLEALLEKAGVRKAKAQATKTERLLKTL